MKFRNEDGVYVPYKGMSERKIKDNTASPIKKKSPKIRTDN